MIAISSREKRLLAAIGVSLIIHTGLLFLMGFWSLHSVSPPSRYDPVLLTIEPDILSLQEKRPVELSDKPVTDKPEVSKSGSVDVKKAFSDRAAESLSKPAEKGASMVRDTEKSVSVSETPLRQNKSNYSLSPKPSSGAISTPDTYLPKESNELPVPPPVRRPVPKGTSRMVYDTEDDKTGDKGTTKSLTPKVVENNNRILSNAEISALSERLDAVDTGTSDTADKSGTPLPDTAAAGESAAKLSTEKLPDNVILEFDGDNKRVPLSDLKIEIPDELLESIDHDSTIDIKFTLSPEGRILQPEVISSDVSSMVEADVLKSLRDWAFEADRSTKRNITGRITIKFKVK